MSRFSPSDVALEGFRLTRERPLAVLAWALVRIAFAVVTVLAVASVGGDALSKLAALQQGAVKISDAEATRLLSRSLPALGLTLLLNFAVYALVYTAAMRAIFRPADKAFAYLRLSADEVRQFILALLTTVVFFALAFLLVVVTVVIWSLADALGPIGDVADRRRDVRHRDLFLHCGSPLLGAGYDLHGGAHQSLQIRRPHPGPVLADVRGLRPRLRLDLHRRHLSRDHLYVRRWRDWPG